MALIRTALDIKIAKGQLRKKRKEGGRNSGIICAVWYRMKPFELLHT
jgi:hypothetical protein